MASPSGACRRSIPSIAVAIVAVMLGAHIDTVAKQRDTAPRLGEARLPPRLPEAFGGGEVVLELNVDTLGTVTRVARARVTPPYTDLLATWAAEWRFEPATVSIEGRSKPIAASVLVVAVFRPASLYAGPAPGVPPQVLGAPSPRVPRVESIVMPAYPPTATGDGIVLVEIEISGQAEPRSYRIIGPASGFDTAALDAVRSWRFGAPQSPDVPDPLFAYAVVGFRTPLAPRTRTRQ